MLSLLRLNYSKFLEHLHQKGFTAAFCFIFYSSDEAVPVAKDLNAIPQLKVSNDKMQLIEVTPDNFSSMAFKTPYRSCLARAKVFFRKGYRALALVREGTVVGDLWYVSRKLSQRAEIHPDLQRLKIDLADDEVYMFDMHVSSQERGGGLATLLLSNSLHHLHHKGYRRAWGYYSATNIPALWVHRLVGYKEFPHFILRRFFVYRKALAKN